MKGLQGDSGADGYSGQTGYAGRKGEVGNIGYSGPPGKYGFKVSLTVHLFQFSLTTLFLAISTLKGPERRRRISRNCCRERSAR